MTTNSKRTSPTRFLSFGVDNTGIVVPLLKRGKDNLVHVPSATRPSGTPNKHSPPAPR